MSADVSHFFPIQNPFLHRRENHRQSNPEKPTIKFHIGISGRANSAPGSYDWMQDRQLSADSSLEAVKEVAIGSEATIAAITSDKKKKAIDKRAGTIEKR